MPGHRGTGRDHGATRLGPGQGRAGTSADGAAPVPHLGRRAGGDRGRATGPGRFVRLAAGSAFLVSRDSFNDQVRAVLDKVAARLAVPAHDARLLHLHSNASFALPSAGLVVPIATNPAALDRVTASIAVTRWLARPGLPSVLPPGPP